MKNGIGWAWLMPVMFLMAGPIAATAGQFGDFTYSSDGSAITITGYTGPGGAVVIPDTIEGLPVTRIGEETFSGNHSLTSVTIPDSVAIIDAGVFAYSSGLMTITVTAGNSVYSSIDGVLFNKSQTTLIQCPNGRRGDYTIPGTVTNIGDRAFHYCMRLANITIPGSVTSIGAAAFCNCRSLVNITIPGSVTSMRDYVFMWSFNLERICFLGNAPDIGADTFYSISGATIYYLPGTTGWGPTFGGLPTVLLEDPATISTQPEPLTNYLCSSAGFTVVASGTGPLYYQWQKDGANIALATHATYTINSVRLNDAGDYRCLVSSLRNSVTSMVATLTIIAAQAPNNDYNRDGISDLAVFDNNSGYWYAYSLQSGQPTVWRKQWGWPGAETVPGDYDGDGFSDLAVYDQAGGTWYAWSAARNKSIVGVLAWGWSGAVPVPGDYNGDGISDFAVFDGNTGKWYVLSSDEATVLAWDMAWGWPGAVPVPGDYDNDGKDDFAVFDGNTGKWYVLSSDQATILAWDVAWGWPGAVSVPGDYDGDGKADFSVFDSNTGKWYVLASDKTTVLAWSVAWGWPGAIPVPGDYDGDRNADLAVFDNSSGSWYVWSVAQDTTLAWAQPWGWPGVIPPGGRE